MSSGSSAQTRAGVASAMAAAKLPEKMRAIVQSAYGTAEVLRFTESPLPSIGEGQVLLRVHAAGLDRGTWHLMAGKPYLMRIMGFGFGKPNNPVPGLDVAGTVVDVGPGVTRFAVGDEVFGIGEGSFAEYARARADKLARKPARLSFQQAAVVGVSGLTALHALCEIGHVTAGQHVLIIGASGGVGSYAVQIAKAKGAEVTGVCSTAKLEMVRALGADHVIDYSQQSFESGATRYDLILDIGGNASVARLRRALTAKGTAVFVGGEDDGDWVGGLFVRALGALVLSAFVGQRFAMCMSKEHFVGLEQLAALIEAGQLSPALDRSYPLQQVPDAMRQLEAGQVRGKVAIDVRGQPGTL